MGRAPCPPAVSETRLLTSALITIWRRTREALPHLEQNWRSSDCCRVKQPEQRSTCGGRAKRGEMRAARYALGPRRVPMRTQCLIDRNTIPSTDSSLSPICISTDCIA